MKGTRIKSRLASFAVDSRRPIFICILIVTVVCAYLMTRVEINQDLTRYLPTHSQMKQGTDIMAEEFPPAPTVQTVRVMFQDLREEEKPEVLEKLRSIPNVTDVAWVAEDPDYNREEHTLYVLSSDAAYKSPEMKAIRAALDRDFQGYEMVWHDDDISMPEIPLWILLSAVAVILLILLCMCESWLEPFLFLVGIGFAVAINQGTNIFQGSVSSVTASMSAILQLVLSMDYSIILSNRFRQERQRTDDSVAAMKAAVANAFPSIVSSGLTTVAGLLMLVFMSFRIGMDLGIVLAKGVFLSMFCVLAVMPGMLLACEGQIRKTAKKSLPIPVKALSAFSFRAHIAITVVFVILAAGAFILQRQTGFVYTLQRDDPVAEVFPADNIMVLVYDNEDEAAIPGVAAGLTEDSSVKSVTSYYTALGTPCTAEEMVRNLPEMEGGLPLNADVLSMIYWLRYGEEPPAMTVSELLSFLSGHVVGNELFESFLTEDQRQLLNGIGNYTGLVSLIAGNDPKTPEQMAELFSGISPDMNKESLELLYLYRAGVECGDPGWTMTLEEMFEFICGTVQDDPRFAPLLNDEARAMLSEGRETLSAGKQQLVGPKHSRMIITTRYPDEAVETFDFIDRLSASCGEAFGKPYYLIGNSVMNLEMSRSFGSEYLFITLLTAGVIFLIVLLSARRPLIPLILVLIVQTGVFITVASIGLAGDKIYFLALLIVQCILMGATIDYGILFTNYYTENRRTCGIAESVRKAYEGAVHTIVTSGLILVVAPAIVGRFFQDPTITAIVNTISLGALSAMILVLFFLPGILITCDRLVSKRVNGDGSD